MVKPVIFGIGKLGLRLAVAFLGVALDGDHRAVRR